MADSPRRFPLFVGALVALFLLLEAALYRSVDVSLIPTTGLIAFTLLALASQYFPLDAPRGSAIIDVSGTIFWAMLVLFEPFWVGLCAFTAYFVAEIGIRRRSFLKATFNGAQVGLSAVFASLSFLLIQGRLGLETTPRFLLAFMVAVLVYWASNTLLVSAGAQVLYKNNAYRFWRSNFKWYWIYELTSAPIALAISFSYVKLSIVGLVFIVPPLLLTRLAYSQFLDLKKTYRETVRTLVKVIEMNDAYTAGHSDRVAHYSRRICEELKISPARTERIELAAYLHDLGKIHLDLSGIVRKAGRLTDEERKMIKLHPVLSADLAEQVTYFQGEIKRMILHHHENWDGSGYPHGLKGKDIPFGSRVILLADAFDAMTTSRVYRGALELDDVKNEFRKFSGIQFDPQLIPVFLDRVIGDGSGMVKPATDEPIEGQRATALESARSRKMLVLPQSTAP